MSVEGAAVSLAATVLSIAFTVLVARQWLAQRKAYQLAWSLGLLVFTIAAFTQFLSETYGWSVLVYQIYYLMAAPLVAVLGVGSAFLLDRRLGIAFAIYTAGAFILFAIAIATATVDTSAFALPIVAGSAMPDSVRLWSPVFTIPGSIALIGVALYSFYRTRLSFNLWIAAGAIVAAAGGSLERFGVAWALYAGELLGIALLFWGFLSSVQLARLRQPRTEKAPT